MRVTGMRLALVLASLPSLGCELGSFLATEATRPPLRFELERTDVAPGDPVRADVVLAPQPGVSYTFAIVDPNGAVISEAPLSGSETVELVAPGPGSYEVQIRADGRMRAHGRLTVE